MLIPVNGIPYIEVNTTDPGIPEGKFKYKILNLDVKDGYTHTSTSWYVEDENNNPVIDRPNDTDNLTVLYVDKSLFRVGVEYNVMVTLNFEDADGNPVQFRLNSLPYVADKTTANELEPVLSENYVLELNDSLEEVHDVANELLTNTVATIIYSTAKTI